MLTGTDVRKMLGVSRLTMMRYVKAGKLHPTVVSRKLYLYDESEVFALLGRSMKTGTEAAVYARVQSHAQQQQLDEQLAILGEFAARNGIVVNRTYTDMCHSTEFGRGDRKGLHELMSDVIRGRVGLVIMESPDRISYIGHELFVSLISHYRVRVIYVCPDPINARHKEETIKELHSYVKTAKDLLNSR